ncbi:hypothetical protein COR50_14665 [Chitinophaga caeni]|uniref:DUF6089 domain-containing protein n=1 Tax=Chitinophaga caeni TaxID=2029983 RepID=A0A291QWJ8_9BACT|nr:DUF6089 family protein [Chitinophaga caeni]ATL48307.1 hypothetical protein COR50_14665 [Chitinophaga caeni]
MKKYFIIPIVLFCLPVLVMGQDWHVGGMAGISNYNGDLSEKTINFKHIGPTLGLFVRRDVNRYLSVRAGFQWGMVAAADSSNSSQALKDRNLSFRSHIGEISLVGEFNFFDIYERGYTPYIFAGIGGFLFNPMGKTQNGNWVNLRDLGTEGQGMQEYADRLPYNLFQFAVPFGVGFRYELDPKWTVGVEVGARYTSTDYLDDVSKTYVDENLLLQYRGQLAVDMAYRGDEVNPKTGNPGVYPPDGTVRGNPGNKDWYAFTGLTVTYRLGGRNKSFGRAIKNTGCANMKF